MPPRRAQPAVRVAVPRVSARQAASRTRSGASSAPVAAQAPAPVPALFLDDDECPVCTFSLASMRSVQFLPCGHRFHRTCAFEWLESRESRREHCCPLYRCAIEKIKANGRAVDNVRLAYGRKQDQYVAIVMRDLRDCRKAGVASWLLQLTRKEVAVVQGHRRAALKEGKKADSEWIEDIDKELGMLKERMKAFTKEVDKFREAVDGARNAMLERIRNGERLMDVEMADDIYGAVEGDEVDLDDIMFDMLVNEEDDDDDDDDDDARLEMFRAAIDAHEATPPLTARHEREVIAAFAEGDVVRRQLAQAAAVAPARTGRGRQPRAAAPAAPVAPARAAGTRQPRAAPAAAAPAAPSRAAAARRQPAAAAAAPIDTSARPSRKRAAPARLLN